MIDHLPSNLLIKFSIVVYPSLSCLVGGMVVTTMTYYQEKLISNLEGNWSIIFPPIGQPFTHPPTKITKRNKNKLEIVFLMRALSFI